MQLQKTHAATPRGERAAGARRTCTRTSSVGSTSAKTPAKPARKRSRLAAASCRLLFFLFLGGKTPSRPGRRAGGAAPAWLPPGVVAALSAKWPTGKRAAAADFPPDSSSALRTRFPPRFERPPRSSPSCHSAAPRAKPVNPQPQPSCSARGARRHSLSGPKVHPASAPPHAQPRRALTLNFLLPGVAAVAVTDGIHRGGGRHARWGSSGAEARAGSRQALGISSLARSASTGAPPSRAGLASGSTAPARRMRTA